MIAISLSILNADFTCLREVIPRLAEYVDAIHIDIMDGSITPRVSFGPWMISVVGKLTSKPIEVHLYVKDPMKFMDVSFQQGASRVLLDKDTLLRLVREGHSFDRNSLGLYLLSDESVHEIGRFILEEVSIVNLLSVEVLDGGQPFSNTSIEQLVDLIRVREEYGYPFAISLDGGVNRNTINRIMKYPIQQLVIGTAILKSNQPLDEIKSIREILSNHG